MWMSRVFCLAALIINVASQQCEQGSCRLSAASTGLPEDETSLLQVKTDVSHAAHGSGGSFLQNAIRFLNGHLTEEGLWRKEGSKEDATALQSRADSGDTDIPPTTNAQTVVLTLKRMITNDPIFNVFLCKALSASQSTPSKINFYLEGPQGLSPTKQSELKLLLEHWHRVIENEASNRMNVKTLADVTAIFIIAPEAMPEVFMNKESMFTRNLIRMIELPDQILPKVSPGQCSTPVASCSEKDSADGIPCETFYYMSTGGNEKMCTESVIGTECTNTLIPGRNRC